MKALIYILPFFPLLLNGQISFFNSYGGSGNDYGKSIISDIDSGYTFVGATESFGAGNTDLYLVKIDSIGNFVWSKTFGGANVDWGMDLQQTSDSGYIITGYSNSFDFDYEVYTIKTDKNGDSIWTRKYGGNDWDFGYGIAILNDSTYIIAGETYSFGNGTSDGYILAINNKGDTLWTKTYGGSSKDKFNDVLVTSTNELLFTGSTTSTDGDTDFWVVKTDSDGNELWQYTAGDSLNDEATMIIEGNDGNYYFMGNYESILGTEVDFGVTKLAPGGNLVGTLPPFNNTNRDEGCFILQYAGESSFFEGGKSNSYGNGGFDAYYAEVDNNGYVMNGHLLTNGTSFDEITENADTTYDHGLIMIGTTTGTNLGISSIFVIKIDSNFNSPSTMTEDFDISSVIEVDEKIEVNIFPNPATTQITIDNEIYVNKTYVIYSVSGKRLLRGKLTNQFINIESLSTGAYHLFFPSVSREGYMFTKI